MKCQYCENSVTDPNTGALCPWHLDLEVMADYLLDHNQPVTLKALTALIDLGTKRGGSFVIASGDLPSLITQEFTEKYQMAMPV